MGPLGALLVVALHLLAPSATAQIDHSPAAILTDAAKALDAGEYQRAADLARGVLANAQVKPVDRAEAWRLFGLASFFLDRYDEAEAAFLAFLKIEVDGRLDPALVPPEAIGFFEDVRARHAAELRKYRPKPESKRYWMLNLIPPMGQMQNGQRTKGWFIVGASTVLLATNLTTYGILRSWCDPVSGVCESGGESRADAATTLRAVNLVSGILLAGVLTYSIYDGFRHYRHNRPRSRTAALQICPTLDCGYVSIQGRL